MANRLSAALYREVAYLIDQDVVSVADADAAVCMGPGLRWALMGPTCFITWGADQAVFVTLSISQAR